MSKRIVFVEQFYYPDGWGGAELPRDLTIALASRGYRVEVLCGSEQYSPVDGPPGPDPGSFGVRIVRLPALLRGKIHRRKLLRQLWFYACLIPPLFFRARPDVFISQTNPPLGVVLTALAARLLRRPLLIIAMDIYPEVLIAHGALRSDSVIARVLRAVFDWSYHSARRVVSLGPVMTRRLERKGVDAERIIEISTWATGPLAVVEDSENPLRQSLDLPEGLTLVYSGNLGIGHEFDTLLQGFARACRSRSDLALVIIGGGSRLAEVRRAVSELGIAAAVRFVDYLPAHRLSESMGLADVAVVTLRSGFEGLMVPSKLFGYMARGLPVLYVGPPSDVEHFVSRYGCGITVANSDVAGVESAICRFRSDDRWRASLGAAGRGAYESELTRACGIAHYVRAIDECIVAESECSCPS